MANPKPTKKPEWASDATALLAWTPSTAYAVDTQRRNGQRVYEVLIAGTSAASGGPTGTGPSITDGTVVWAYAGEWITSAPSVEPTTVKKKLGWLMGESPPAQFFNWLFNTIYLWVLYLDTFTENTLTWTAANTFSSTVRVQGALQADTSLVVGNPAAVTISSSGTVLATSSGTFSGGVSTAGGSLSSTGALLASTGNFSGALTVGAGVSVMTGGVSVASGGMSVASGGVSALAALQASGAVGATNQVQSTGTMGGTAGNNYPLFSVRASSPNAANTVRLTTRALMRSTATDWINVGLGFTYDVDGSVGSGGSFYLGATGATITGGTAATGAAPTAALELTNGHLKLSGVSPDSSTALTNLLAPPLILKAWARIIVSGGGSTTATIIAGANVAGATVSGTNLDLTLAAGISGVTQGGAKANVELTSKLVTSCFFPETNVVNVSATDIGGTTLPFPTYNWQSGVSRTVVVFVVGRQ